MTVNFAEILSRPVESAERPKPLPAGTYRLQITGFEYGSSSKKQTPYVRFNYSVVSPMQDVNTEQLAGIDLAAKKLRDDFYLTADALYRLREYLEKKLNLNVSGRPFGACIAEVPGKTVIASVVQNPSQREGDDSIYNEISGYAIDR